MSHKITIGKLEGGGALKIDVPRLTVTRLLVTADSGGGKSWLLRKIIEEASATMQTIIVDPEGEFASLRELRDMVLAGPGGEAPAEPRSAGLLCRKLMELNLSAVIDLSEQTTRQRQEFAKTFCETLVSLPKALWHPCLVVIDEAHEFAPEEEKSVSETAVAELSVKGRKRGYCLVCATQRLSKLSKNVAAGLKNQFLGTFSLDSDIKRAASSLGFGKDRWAEIRDLSSKPGHEGEFFCVGPALNHRGVLKIRAGEVNTTHPKPGQGRSVAPPEPSKKILGVLDELKDLPQQAEQEIRDLAAAKAKIDQLERELRAKPRPDADPATLERAVATARAAVEKQWAAVVAKLKGALEQAMKVIAEVNSKGFEEAGVDPEQVRQAVEAATAQIVKLIENRMSAREAEFELWKKKAAKLLAEFQKLIGEDVHVKVDVQHNRPFTITPTADRGEPATRRRAAPTAGDNGSSLSSAQRRLLNAVAWWSSIGVQAPTRAQVGFVARIKPTGGHFSNSIGPLVTHGLLENIGDGQVRLTDEGAAAAVVPSQAPTLEEYQRGIREVLATGAQQRIYDVIVAARGEDMTVEQIGEYAGIDPSGGHFSNSIGPLSTLGLIDRRGGVVRPTELLFPSSLQ